MSTFNEQVKGLFALTDDDKSPLQSTLNTMRTPATRRPTIKVTEPSPQDAETALRNLARNLFTENKD